MTPRDAYEDGMEPVFWCSERDVERIVAGKEPVETDSYELASFVHETNEIFVRPPADAVAVAHLAAVLEAVRSFDGPTREPYVSEKPRRISMKSMHKRRSRAFALAAVTAALTAGLAVAGVDLPTLPDQASDEAEKALVNAAAAQERGENGQGNGENGDNGENGEGVRPAFVAALRAYIESVPPSERGCEFGQQVATIASGRDPTENDPCAARDENGNGNNAPGGGGAAQGGQATGDQASGGVSAQARSGGVSGGSSVGDQASGGASSGARENGAGAQTGNQASGGVAGQAVEQAGAIASEASSRGRGSGR